MGSTHDVREGVASLKEKGSHGYSLAGGVGGHC